MSTTPKSNDDKTAATGRSEPDKANPVPFTDRKDAGPSKGSDGGDDASRDAGEIADEKRHSKAKDEAAPGAIPPDKLTTETDDGAA